IEGFLTFSDRRDLREQAFRAWINRGAGGGATDNAEILAEIVRLRAEMAKLKGYASYADYALADTMAKTPAAVRELLDRVWPAAKARALEERDALANRVRSEGANFKIEPWDWRYYAERERKARYDLDEGELRAYLKLDNVVAAAFDTASRLFGLRFTELADAPRYHPDVRVFDVTDATGNHVAVFMADYFARSGKRSGAWMTSLRTGHKLDGKSVRPIVLNVMNFARGDTPESTLISMDDARTLFHEFGHGLHGMLSNVTYPSIAGTAVARDFVELPSQLFEHWFGEPEVLRRFALHHETGEPMPQSLIDRLNAAQKFNQGFATVEYTACAMLDIELHTLPEASAFDAAEFEREALDRIGMPAEIVMRHRLPHFTHITGGYAAGYYSYLWSEVMDADAFAAFKEAGDIYDPSVAERLKTAIYAAGNSQDPHDAYIAFRGRPPKIEGLLHKRGL
ncbi:MAG: M3 family metallopeptidase, partial [Gammaproteobacteria bacterium]